MWHNQEGRSVTQADLEVESNIENIETPQRHCVVNSTQMPTWPDLRFNSTPFPTVWSFFLSGRIASGITTAQKPGHMKRTPT